MVFSAMVENELEKDVAYVLFTEEQIKARVKEIADQINEEYAGKDPLILGILKGVYPFYADLMRGLIIHAETDFLIASSYGNGTVSTGVLKIKKDTDIDLKGRHVIIVEDIIDSGNTLYLLKNELLKREPASLKIATLLNKTARRERPIDGDYIGFDCCDEFVVGYGLDYAGKYRNLPYVGVLKEKVYKLN